MNYMVQAPCQHDCCEGMALAAPAFCFGCQKVLCQEHLDSPAHRNGCRRLDPPVALFEMTFENALRDLDLDILRAEMRILRPGHTVSEFVMPDMTDIDEECHGGLNIHIPIVFDDGLEWMLRLSEYRPFNPPFELLKMMRESEVATMKALQNVTDYVAKVHDWGVRKLSKTKDQRCSYIIVDKKAGKSVEMLFCDMARGSILPPLAYRRSFVESYADFSIQVASLSYDSIGSLTLGDDGNSFSVGPWFALHGVSSISSPYVPGPFKTMRDRYIEHIDRILDMTRSGLLGRARPLLFYLIHLVAKSLVLGCAVLAKEGDEFYIRQPDAREDQYMTDSDGNITAVLDWELANTTCKTHAFSATLAIYGTEGWANGDNAMTEGELMLCEVYERRGRSDLADCVRSGRRYQRLEHLLGEPGFLDYDSPISTPWLLGALNGMVTAFLGDQAGPLPNTREDWIQWALARHSDDPGLPEVMELDTKEALSRPAPPVSAPGVMEDGHETEAKTAMPVSLSAC